jgi:hypothetical protein
MGGCEVEMGDQAARLRQLMREREWRGGTVSGRIDSTLVPTKDQTKTRRAPPQILPTVTKAGMVRLWRTVLVVNEYGMEDAHAFCTQFGQALAAVTDWSIAVHQAELADGGTGSTNGHLRLIHVNHTVIRGLGIPAVDDLILRISPNSDGIGIDSAKLSELPQSPSRPALWLVVDGAASLTEARIAAERQRQKAARLLKSKVGVLGYVLGDVRGVVRAGGEAARKTSMHIAGVGRWQGSAVQAADLRAHCIRQVARNYARAVLAAQPRKE